MEPEILLMEILDMFDKVSNPDLNERDLGDDERFDQDRERRREKGTHFREAQELDITEDQLAEIAEELVVDLENVRLT